MVPALNGVSFRPLLKDLPGCLFAPGATAQNGPGVPAGANLKGIPRPSGGPNSYLKRPDTIFRSVNGQKVFLGNKSIVGRLGLQYRP